MNDNKVPDARPRAASHPKGQGRTVSGEEERQLTLVSAALSAPTPPFAPLCPALGVSAWRTLR